MEKARRKVLQVLSDPAHPDLPAKLRFAAAAVSKQKHRDLPQWLDGGLFTHLLHVLETLPSLGLPPADAAHTCTAAAAVLCNILSVVTSCGARLQLPAHHSLQSLTAALATPRLLAPVVQLGMLSPAAAEPLPPGLKVHLQQPVEYLLPSTKPKTPPSSSTPLGVCGFLLSAVILGDSARSGASTYADTLVSIREVVTELVDARVYRQLLEIALEESSEMPWLVMSSTAYRNADPARECLRPLLPLLRRVLARMRKALQAATRNEKPALAGRFARRLMLLSSSFVEEDYTAGGGRAAHTFLLELCALVLDFAIDLNRDMKAWTDGGALAGPNSQGAPNDCEAVMAHIMGGCCLQLVVLTEDWEASRGALDALPLQQAMLLKWLRWMEFMAPAAARSVLDLATKLLVLGPGHGAVGEGGAAAAGQEAQGGAVGESQETAAEFLGGLVTGSYPGLKWAVQQLQSLPLQEAAITLVYVAATVSAGPGGLPPPRAMEGILQLLTDVDWSSLRVLQPLHSLLLLCQRAASTRQLSGASSTATIMGLKIVNQILPSCACRESLSEVQHYVDCLEDIESGKAKHGALQAAPPPSKVCLLAIGAHIEGKKLPYWLNSFVDAATLWQFVATATRHRMRGEQLAALYSGIRQQADILGAVSAATPTDPAAANTNTTVSALALQLLARFDPGSWWAPAQGLLRAYIACPHEQARLGAEEAALAGISWVAGQSPGVAFGEWPFDKMMCICRVLLTAQARLQRPYTFSRDALWCAEPVRMDLWLAAAALGMCGALPRTTFRLAHVHESRGWEWVKAWSLEYARGVMQRGGGVGHQGRRPLRFECAKEIAKRMALGVGGGRAEAHVEFGRLWVEELEGVVASEGTAGALEQGGRLPVVAAACGGHSTGPLVRGTEVRLVGNRGGGAGGSNATSTATASAASGTNPTAGAHAVAAVAAAAAVAAPAVDERRRCSASVCSSGAAVGGSTAQLEAAVLVSGTARASGKDWPSTQCADEGTGDRRCGQCGGHHEELQVCSGCMGAKYCSTECQRAHWRGHRRECKRVQRQRAAAFADGSADAG